MNCAPAIGLGRGNNFENLTNALVADTIVEIEARFFLANMAFRKINSTVVNCLFMDIKGSGWEIINGVNFQLNKPDVSILRHLSQSIAA